MKEIKKLMINPKNAEELAVIEKINELVEAFNELNDTTRKMVFKDKENKDE